MAEKRRRCALTVEVKRKIIKCVEDNPTKKKQDIAKEFNIPQSTLSTVLKNKAKFEEESDLSAKTKKSKSCELKDVEECVLKWLKNCRDKNVPIGGPILQEKAQQFAVQLGHANFRASNGWLQNFKKRNELVFRKVCGESASVDDSVCTEWKEKIAGLTDGFAPDAVYNADETGLFFKCLPDKTISFKGDKCHGGKSSKDRVTVLLCANSTGTHKLKPLVIGKSKRPRCFKNVNDFPTDYMANKKAWMNCDTFSDWLKKTDKEMKKKKKKIIIFVDNCTAHGDLPKLTNITLKFFPPNTTSKLQPLDQGIIRTFKANYRREVVQQFLNDIEQKTPTKISVLDAMWMITKAWNKVTPRTIANCFKKGGFQAPIEDEDDISDPSPSEVTVTPAHWDAVREELDLQDMDFEEFVTFDDEVAVCGQLTESEIVSSVSSVPDEVDAEDEDEEDEVDSESVQPDPTVKDAREAINVLKNVFAKKGNLCESVVNSINELDCALDMIQIKGKQSTIYDFFTKANQNENKLVENND